VIGGEVWTLEISPDGSRVVYMADQDTDEIPELYTVPAAGGAATKLNAPLPGNGRTFGSFRISADSTTVVYRAEQDTEGVSEFYSVPLSGGPSIKLNDTPVPGGGGRSIKITPDSTRAVYVADQDTDRMAEIYSVPLGGGTPIKLNHPLSGDDFVGANFYINADNLVVYGARHEGQSKIYSVPVTGGTPIKLNGPLVEGGGVETRKLSADGSRVLYRGDQDTVNRYELYSVPTTGGEAVKCNDPLYHWVASYDFSPDSRQVVYRADQDTEWVLELYTLTEEVFDIVVDDVDTLFADGVLTAEQAESLTVKLDNAMDSQERGNTTPACNKLGAFINNVEAYVNDETLTPDQGQALIDAANSIGQGFGC
jgi:Tol biopolymer transport system component